MFRICNGSSSADVFYAVDIQCEVIRMTDAERDAIHEHILQLKHSDRKLSELLLSAMQEREMLLRWMKNSSAVPKRATTHDFGDELLSIQ